MLTLKSTAYGIGIENRLSCKGGISGYGGESNRSWHKWPVRDHAPIISSLSNGEVVYQDSDGEHVLNVIRGFVEVRKNNVDICVEV